jgi:hypothetical protein
MPRYTYAISALRDRRARLAGQIEATERTLAKQRSDLATIDATLRLFHPDANPAHVTAIRPVFRSVWFRHGEHSRLCREALARACGPMPTREVIEYMMRAKGFDRDDRSLRAQVAMLTRNCLARLERKGVIRKFMVEPDAWWELVG